ncbi:hypothetical protein TWF192_005425 [Orbilia oligospora]|uniref:Glycosyl transferase CAP10 domain-containing protein n=1 Tax=Orbilia oligospora TaxID=2813651 RepID=A0A6G1MAI2_ORBOL|nr:hypothetical protein TWF191_008369 [Orbilia oligospora]KAF3249929.1 hypothetical protein TWF192_005425 [Orbilia oligospora]
MAAGEVRPWPVFMLAFVGCLLCIVNVIILTGVDVKGKISKIVLPKEVKKAFPYFDPPNLVDDIDLPDELDQHPIVALTRDQLKKFDRYKRAQPKSFAQVVEKYRLKYGRHPPPNFDEWYKFAKKRKCVNFDDFDQIMDDLRPFWGMKPADIRAMIKAMDTDQSRVSILKVRGQKVAQTSRPDAWRASVFERMLAVAAPLLPDLDIAMNYLDEPRVVAPWEEVQAKLAQEKKTRVQHPETVNEFSKIDWDAPMDIKNLNLGFFDHSGKPYMDLASKACPPESYARRPELDIKHVESKYKDPVGGFIRNFNLSSDLCTIGPHLANLHGFLFSSSTTIATQKLVPIFGECKVNVNNDILFPANKYYDLADPRYIYNDEQDVAWHEKTPKMVWRGVTSGGVQNSDIYHRLQRHRFVALTNSSKLSETEVTIMEAVSEDNISGEYTPTFFHPAHYADSTMDVGFSAIVWCVPDCHFLDDKLAAKPSLEFKETFKFKYLADIDGHSFSGRWYAFLKSRSMGIKSTIFREWHDQRLFEWVHFAPMDNRFDDLYALMTYFTGVEKGVGGSDGAYVPRHDTEAKRIADRSREWAMQVLRTEDIEIYMLRLLLEYARVVDDNRDKIGYSGDGSEVDSADNNRLGWRYRL